MKMYIEPLEKEVLDRYLSVQDLTQADESHAIKLLYKKIGYCQHLVCNLPRWIASI